jgi:hypothetical protein
MSEERRIGRMYEKLSATERARLALEAYKDDRRLDVLVDWTTPDDQRLELSRLVRRIISLNTNVAWLLTSWEARMRLLETQWAWYLTLRQWATMAREASAYLLLQEFDGSDVESEDAQRVRERLQAQLGSAPLSLAAGSTHVPLNDADERAAALLATIGEGLARLWREYHAAEQVVSEVAKDFAGDEPLDPELRARMDQLREHLEGLTEDLQALGPSVELAEPPATMVAETRQLLLHERG